jgi:hypothetical protein
MTRHQGRDPRSGRWSKVPTENTPLAKDSHFDTMRELEVQAQGADPADLAYKTVGRDQDNASPAYDAPRVQDDLGDKGSPLRARNPRLVPGDEQAETIYGTHAQGRVGRVAAARGPRDLIPGTDIEQDASRYLTGAE